MAALTEERLRAALRDVADPASGRDIVTAGLVDSLAVRDGLVHLALRTDRAQADAMEQVRRSAETLLARWQQVDTDPKLDKFFADLEPVFLSPAPGHNPAQKLNALMLFSGLLHSNDLISHRGTAMQTR